MGTRTLATVVSLSLLAVPAIAGDQEALRIFLRAGPKTHGPGQHDHPRFLEDWKVLLRERGAEVAGELRFPTEAELQGTDVLVLFAAEGASIHGEDRATLERYLARGGGIVALHDAVCGDDPHWFKTIVGGAWEHGHAKWLEGEIGLYFADREHPITRGIANFDLVDEIYYDLHVLPEANVLASSFHTVFDITPQTWTFEQGSYRAFVSIQGHEYATFSHPAWRGLVLRGIAWAGKRDADLFTRESERASFSYPPGGPTAPEKSLDSFDLHEDFRMSLVAAEPLIANPISIDWDPRGRMWIAETPGYPDKSQFSGIPPHDRISILDDTDGDGLMETKKVFHEGLDLVTSLVFHQDGVIVSAAPAILWLRDSDGDDRADKVEPLYAGFGFGDTHAVVSNLRWGLDGWIYATQGYSGGDSRDIVGKDGAHFGHIGNGIFRFQPDGSAIEMVSSYGSNTWGLDFTWDGELLFSMANGSHLRHVVMSEAELARGRLPGVESWKEIVDHTAVEPATHPTRSPYVQIDFVGAFTAAAGCCVYTGGAWPSTYDTSVFVCEPTVNLVHRDVITPDGVSFTASKPDRGEFLRSRDLWFRPVHARVGPDGALYVLDFYNQAAVHNDTRGPRHGPTNAAIRPDRDQMHGRIWRVQHERANPVVAMVGASSSDRFRTLESKSGWARWTAHRLLREDGWSEGVGESPTSISSFTGRLHEAWLGLPPPAFAPAYLKHSAEVRRTYARVAALAATPEAARALLDGVAYEADARGYLLGLTAQGRFAFDRGVAAQVVLAYRYVEDDWSRSAVLGELMKDPVASLEILVTSRDNAELVDLAGELGWRIGRAQDRTLAGRAVAVLGSDPESGAPHVAAALAGLAETLDPAVLPEPMDAAFGAVKKLLKSKSLDVIVAALPFAARWDTKGELSVDVELVVRRLVDMTRDDSRPLEMRLAALRSMLALPRQNATAIEAAKPFLAPTNAPKTVLAAIDALGRVVGSVESERLAAETLLAAWPSLSEAAREQVFHRMVQRPAWAERIVYAIENGTLALNDLGIGRAARLERHPDASLSTRAREAFAKVRTARSASGTGESSIEALVARLLPEVQAPGDLVRGRDLFAINCGICHTLRGEGGKVGPDLTGMGAHGIAELLPIVLDPNRTVEAAYVEFVAETEDGRLHAGVLVRDSAESIVLRSSAGDEEVLREEIVSLESTGRSPMPTGFEELGAEALRDIFAYLGAGYEGFRLINLADLADASTTEGIYDRTRDRNPMRMKSLGTLDVGGVPFEVLDPTKTASGFNVLALKGGHVDDWESRTRFPQRVEVPVGLALARVHVLGGIAAWGHPYGDLGQECVKWIWRYADGTSEEVVLRNGVEFADWIRRVDVPGSTWVDLVGERSAGQVRLFAVAPSKATVVDSIVLESYDNGFSPTFLSMTAELPGTQRDVKTEAAESDARVLLVGGGSSHDFARWFGGADAATLEQAGIAGVVYTEDPRAIEQQLETLEVLVLSTNQPIASDELRSAILGFVEQGGGLLILHPGAWYNWNDWPEYNRKLVKGGARSHEDYAAFDVEIVDADHPIVAGVPPTFRIEDELYRFEPDPEASAIHVLATGRSLATKTQYPVLWTAEHGKGRIVGLTLGHDGAAHEHPAFRAILANAAKWRRSGR